MIICKICKKEYKNYKGLSSHIAQYHKISKKEYYDLYLKKENEGICLTCGNNTNFKSIRLGYYDYCCNRCVQLSKTVKNKIKQTNLEKYGVEYASQSNEIKEKCKKNNKEKYGVEYIFQTEYFKNKTKQTSLEKYGVEHISKSEQSKKEKKKKFIEKYGTDNPSKLDEVKNKKMKTCLSNYGTDNPFKSDFIKCKIRETNIKKYGTEYPNQSNEVKENKNKRMFYKIKKYLKELNIELLDDTYNGNRAIHNFLCNKCNTKFQSCWDYIKQDFQKCPICFPKMNGFSKYELEISDFLVSLGIKNIINNSNKIISPYELDIYLPNYKIAIEFNGLFWHSEAMHKTSVYHINKTNMCKEKGIRLIHIFEDEWIFKQDIVKSIIQHILNLNNKTKIHARKCEIKEIDPKSKNLFLEKYHLQGKDYSNIKLGAFYNDKLVSVMTFSKSNISGGFYKKDQHWQLSRFCSDYNYHIPGIASKLLSYFKKNYNWKEISTFADKRWSVGTLYNNLGFKHIYDNEPNYWYIKNFKRIHRYNLRKTKDDPKDIPEWVLRESEGYTKIWDCGNMKYILKNMDFNLANLEEQN